LKLIYLLTAIWFTPGGSSTVHIYTQTIHRTSKLTNLGKVRAVPRLKCYFTSGTPFSTHLDTFLGLANVRTF